MEFNKNIDDLKHDFQQHKYHKERNNGIGKFYAAIDNLIDCDWDEKYDQINKNTKDDQNRFSCDVMLIFHQLYTPLSYHFFKYFYSLAPF